MKPSGCNYLDTGNWLYLVISNKCETFCQTCSNVNYLHEIDVQPRFCIQLRRMQRCGECKGHAACVGQDGISNLQDLEALEIVGARNLRIELGLGTLANLRELEFNACECALSSRLYHPFFWTSHGCNVQSANII